MLEKLGSGKERVRHRGGVGDDGGCAGLVLAEDEATTDGEIFASGQRVSRMVQGVEPHSVGVKVQPLAAVQHDVVIDGEADRPTAGQVQFPVLPDRADLLVHGSRVDLVRGVAQKPEDDRTDAAVSVSGGPERAEQLDLQSCHLGCGSSVVQLLHEHPGGLHGSDGV